MALLDYLKSPLPLQNLPDQMMKLTFMYCLNKKKIDRIKKLKESDFRFYEPRIGLFHIKEEFACFYLSFLLWVCYFLI
ncbi:hypothetical protein M666_14545 [Cellulophaga baltica 18]|uniref:Transposase InsH N-terminal domain-containing protein n=1 Tax=Cellulophaga baltica 18 TaxID=1348584 RepID=A0AAU8RH58_9FLAO|nr:hypothetical protein M666_14545 [Cellulophaga baltica 18]